jgi:prepilin-type N-terminal cleavage/methylation domain-containing protein
MRREAKRGFTLIEVIVVLVILAILITIAVPPLTGYIEKAKDRALALEGHTITTALQSIGTELSATAPDGKIADSPLKGYVTTRGVILHADDWTTAVNSLSATSYAPASIFNVTFDNATLTHYYYQKDEKTILEYDRGTYRVLHEMPLEAQWTVPAQRMEAMISILGVDLVERFEGRNFDITNPENTLTDDMKKELGINYEPYYYADFASYFYTQVARELGYSDTQYMVGNGDSLINLTFNPDGTIKTFILRNAATYEHMVRYEDGIYTYVGPGN